MPATTTASLLPTLATRRAAALILVALALPGCDTTTTPATSSAAVGVVIDTDYDPPQSTPKRQCRKVNGRNVCSWKLVTEPADWDLTIQYGTAEPQEIDVTKDVFGRCPKNASYPTCATVRR
ncbi:hypothetical protein ACQPYK_49810 (plasmid) [Streptosporangium sp. CA-135522]|uniref:hypothetical protein n=1 Tax=Streptosporangium sp. CA-135522 TaxID=3240072 RepID=UPI003D8F4013